MTEAAKEAERLDELTKARRAVTADADLDELAKQQGKFENLRKARRARDEASKSLSNLNKLTLDGLLRKQRTLNTSQIKKTELAAEIEKTKKYIKSIERPMDTLEGAVLWICAKKLVMREQKN